MPDATNCPVPPPDRDIRYADEIRFLQKLNRTEPLPADAVVFTGSSIFRFWSTLERDMAPLPVINRSFGGARTWEVLHYFDRIIAPCRPRLIAYYCGSNDIECGEKPGSVAGRFHAFTVRAMQDVPRCRVFFVSINLAPQKRARWDAVRAVNRMIAHLCAENPALGYIDVNTALLDSRGQPRPEMFQEDGLHLRPAAYRALGAVIQPVLLRAWHDSTGRAP